MAVVDVSWRRDLSKAGWDHNSANPCQVSCQAMVPVCALMTRTSRLDGQSWRPDVNGLRLPAFARGFLLPEAKPSCSKFRGPASRGEIPGTRKTMLKSNHIASRGKDPASSLHTRSQFPLFTCSHPTPSQSRRLRYRSRSCSSFLPPRDSRRPERRLWHTSCTLTYLWAVPSVVVEPWICVPEFLSVREFTRTAFA